MAFDQSIATGYRNQLEAYATKANTGVITSAEVTAATNLASSYYSYLAQNNIAYGGAAKGVLLDQGSFGSYANNLLRDNIEKLHPSWSEAQIDSARSKLAINLAFSDADLRASTVTGVIPYSDIALYHYDNFAISGLPKTAWGGTFFEEFMGSGSYMDMGFNFFDPSPNVNIRGGFIDYYLGTTRNGVNATQAFNEMFGVVNGLDALFLDGPSKGFLNLLNSFKDGYDALKGWGSGVPLATQNALEALANSTQHYFISNGYGGNISIQTSGSNIGVFTRTGSEFSLTLVSQNGLATDQMKAQIGADILSQIDADIAGFDNTLANLTVLNASTNQSQDYMIYGDSAQEQLIGMGASSITGVTTATHGDTTLSLIGNGASAVINGVTYGVGQIFDTLSDTAQAVGEFISNQAEAAGAWFSSPNGAQVSFANWLAQNMGEMIDGNMSADEALISLAKHLGRDYVSDQFSNQITTAIGAKSAIEKILKEEFGITGQTVFYDKDTGLPLPAVDNAKLYADSITMALGRMTVDFALGGFDDPAMAVKGGIATLAGAITSTYMNINNYSTVEAGAAVAAITTAISGILNSGEFDSGDWIMLGVQVGLAAAAGAAGAAIAAEIGSVLIIGVDPITIIASAIISILGSKLIGSIYKGKVFKEGEFDSAAKVLNSIYQVQTITVDGKQVQALVAVNATGSTIVATSNLGYIVGNSGIDILVGSNATQTISANAGSDYIEARGGDDNLIRGALMAANDNNAWAMMEAA